MANTTHEATILLTYMYSKEFRFLYLEEKAKLSPLENLYVARHRACSRLRDVYSKDYRRLREELVALGYPRSSYSSKGGT